MGHGPAAQQEVQEGGLEGIPGAHRVAQRPGQGEGLHLDDPAPLPDQRPLVAPLDHHRGLLRADGLRRRPRVGLPAQVGRFVLVQEDQVGRRVDALPQKLQAGRLLPAVPGVGVVGGDQAAEAGLPEQLRHTRGQARQQEVVAGVGQRAALQNRPVLRGPQGELQRRALPGGHLPRPAGGLVGEDQGEGRAGPGPPPHPLAPHPAPGDLLEQLPAVRILAQLGQQMHLRAQAGQAAGHDPPGSGQLPAPGPDQHLPSPLPARGIRRCNRSSGRRRSGPPVHFLPARRAPAPPAGRR